MHSGGKNSGLTLLEVIFAISIITLIVSAISLVYLTTLKGWAQTTARNDLRGDIQGCFDKLSNELRKGKELTVANQSVRLGVKEGGVDTYYIYYLYHASDVWPPNYTQSSYDLIKTPLSGGLNGTFAYNGSGDIFCTALNPPTSPSCGSTNTCFSSGTKSVTINLAKSINSETINMRNTIRLRNA